jgi:hypothetical protein
MRYKLNTTALYSQVRGVQTVVLLLLLNLLFTSPEAGPQPFPRCVEALSCCWARCIGMMLLLYATTGDKSCGPETLAVWALLTDKDRPSYSFKTQ